MGIYLFMIGAYDLKFRGEYNRHAQAWMDSSQCQVIGSLAMLSTEVSVLLLTYLTLEKYICIVYPFQYLTPGWRRTVTILLGIWVFGFIIAFLPLVCKGLFRNFYGTNGVCFPLHSEQPETLWAHVYSVVIFLGEDLFLKQCFEDFCSCFHLFFFFCFYFFSKGNCKSTGSVFSICVLYVGGFAFIYLLWMQRFIIHVHSSTANLNLFVWNLSIGLNLVAFLIIVLSYASMFYNIQRTGTQTTKYSNHIKKEVTIAKRFFSIVITDSLCWIPIFILKILSLLQVEIPGTVKEWQAFKQTLWWKRAFWVKYYLISLTVCLYNIFGLLTQLCLLQLTKRSRWFDKCRQVFIRVQQNVAARLLNNATWIRWWMWLITCV